MMMNRFGWHVAGWVLCFATSASAADIYVNNQVGDDSRTGLAAEAAGVSGPVRTLRRALDLAQAGDRVVLANTGLPYRESVTLQAGRHSGSPQLPFQLVGNGAILDGTQPVDPARWEFVRGRVFRFRPEKMAFHLLYLDGKPAERVEVPEGASELPELNDRQWCLFDRHIYFQTEPGKLPEAYELTHTALPVGITLYEVRNVVVTDLVVQGFQLDGINAHDGVRNATLAALTVRGNGRAGISVGGASRVTITNCLVGNNGVAQVRTEGFSHTLIENSDLLENTAPAVVRDGGQVTVNQ